MEEGMIIFNEERMESFNLVSLNFDLGAKIGMLFELVFLH